MGVIKMWKLGGFRSFVAASALSLAICSAAAAQGTFYAASRRLDPEQMRSVLSEWDPNRPIKTKDDFSHQIQVVMFLARLGLAGMEHGDRAPAEYALTQAERALAWARTSPLANRHALAEALYWCGDLADHENERKKAESYFTELLAVPAVAGSAQDEYWWRYIHYAALHKILFLRVNSLRGVDIDLVRRYANTETAILRRSLVDSFAAWDERSKFELPTAVGSLVPGPHGPLDAYQYELFNLQDALTIIIPNLLGRPDDIETLANAVVQRKGLIQEVLGEVRHLASQDERHAPVLPNVLSVNRPDPKAHVIDRLRANAAARALLGYANPNFSPTALPRPMDLYLERMALEGTLVRNPSLSFDGPSLIDIKRKIPDDALVIEFVDYLPRYEMNPVKVNRRYLAVGLSSKGVVGVADVGAVDEVNALVARACWSLVYDVNPESAATRCFGDGSTVAGQPPALKEVSAQLYRMLLKPIAPILDQYKTLIVSPDDALNFLPFEILTDSRGQNLLTTHLIAYVQSAREVTQWDRSVASHSPPFVVADPDYDALPDKQQVPCPTEVDVQNTDGGILSWTPWIFMPAMASYLIFPRLCGSQVEASEIEKAFPDVHLLIGRSATEEAVKRLWGPRILHFATHGYVLKHLQWPNVFFSSDHPYWASEDVAVLARDSWLPTGLAFAGANIHRSPDLQDDGLLSAEEASLLNLDGTQLVVLSACDSGLGIAFAGEGVFGLRKAFAMAGARAQTFARWPVPDSTTIRFMAMYYGFLANGDENSLALAKVKRALMTDGADPGIWAAFVGYGNPGPLGR